MTSPLPPPGYQIHKDQVYEELLQTGMIKKTNRNRYVGYKGVRHKRGKSKE